MFGKITDSEDATNTLSPLPPVLKNGLPAVAMFGFLSFFSCLWLFLYLTYKFVLWNFHPKTEKRPTSPEPTSPTTSDINGFLVPAAHLCPPKGEDEKWMPRETFFERLRREPPNQFLMLIYNLLLADIQQAMAFLLNIAWLSSDSLDVHSRTCWAQGWFVSIGDLASSVFISFIAVHTYLGVVKNYRLPTWIFYSIIACCWSFVYGTGILGILITNNGARVGGLYVRAGAWCWINSAFQDLRLTLHYLWIFICLAFTTMVYIAIYVHLQIHSKHSATCCLSASGSGEHYPNPDPNSHAGVGVPSLSSRTPSLAPSSPRSTMTDMSAVKRLPPLPSSARHPTFLLYPIIYVLCTAPLAAGRIASMAGNNVPLSYFCFAGAMIASAGWLDVALYSSTRRAIVFSGEAPPSQDTGIDTFAFMRTPANRKLGNVVFVSAGDPKGTARRRWDRWRPASAKKAGPGARLRSLASGNNSRNGSRETVGGGSVAGSVTNLNMQGFGMGGGEVMGMAIQCETTTSVTVEKYHGVEGEGGGLMCFRVEKQA
ncbi:G protein-coupled glucose receptor regulating Gpa2-domain-containing protein [Echria macrotheca]|uniref:G protein-coupled glucose receptor regulating Gpa2-domain-containing protein n=1 Tax=Echria macrotheca TaxID=438768 RepID=A0AAJ0BGV8_9PEZI|nr:G protein-coupled glucose receptor regulating Gpa2-domain-containing protein [Echria macrotheca]